jgi:lon-related putative ATP-dependent protease
MDRPRDSLQLEPVDRHDLSLPPDALRWRCDAECLDFDSTEEVDPSQGVIGQHDAVEALRFGLEIPSSGHNIFVRGLVGTGRMTLIRHLLEELRPSRPHAGDRCYVHSFDDPGRPRLLTLGPGEGPAFKRRIDRLIDFVADELIPGLSSEKMKARRAELDAKARQHMEQIGAPFEKELDAAGLALVPVKSGQAVEPTILPVIEGEPVSVQKLRQLEEQGRVPEQEAERLVSQIDAFEERFEQVSGEIQRVQDQHRQRIRELYETEARMALDAELRDIGRQFSQAGVSRFLDQLVEDLLGRGLETLEADGEFLELYRVNLLASHGLDDRCPVIEENVPTVSNLLGGVDRPSGPGGPPQAGHTLIRPGSLLRADGGFLILEARDVLSEPGAWKVLVRTLRTGRLEIVPSDSAPGMPSPALQPEPIDVNLKVILLGDPELYRALDSQDPDFAQLFKVLADFDSTIPRDERGVRAYAAVLSRIIRQEGLLPFERSAVVEIVEHGARVAARQRRLTTRFGRLADIAREASFIAEKADRRRVRAEDVERAVLHGRRRADLPARHFHEMVRDGAIRVELAGGEVGQVNGLAVTHAGPLTYGFPTRVTATVGPGEDGAVNIEREAELSGSIHTKAFYILGGLLRHLLRLDHPLAFSASIAFEQSYGGIDGDSASGAETCCLISALTEVPLRQDLAMTGAIDQHGQILPVGAVTEKVEGFFDVCQAIGLSGSQGVMIPRANAGDLMLRRDVAAACGRGRFHVFAVDRIEQALELLTGFAAGARDDSGRYPASSLLGLAEGRARDFWKMLSGRGRRPSADDV